MLLAEAKKMPYDIVLEMDRISEDFQSGRCDRHRLQRHRQPGRAGDCGPIARDTYY